jgi:formate hydrogenlyase subunit 3/multisubunit Na+/H+ antiporter MnhD subunit
MSPKQITRLAFFIAAISAIGLILMAILQPEWGRLAWWPAAGLLLALLLLIVSFVKGAYLSAQTRVELVDKLNDCYTGQSEPVGDFAQSSESRELPELG